MAPTSADPRELLAAELDGWRQIWLMVESTMHGVPLEVRIEAWKILVGRANLQGTVASLFGGIGQGLRSLRDPDR